MKRLIDAIGSIADISSSLRRLLESDRRQDELLLANIRLSGLYAELKDKVTDLELYKSRDIESRRWRRQVDEPCLLSDEKWILRRVIGSPFTLGGYACNLREYDEWRYVSPEDMP